MFVKSRNRLRNTVPSLAAHLRHRGELDGRTNTNTKLQEFANMQQSPKSHVPAGGVHKCVPTGALAAHFALALPTSSQKRGKAKQAHSNIETMLSFCTMSEE